MYLHVPGIYIQDFVSALCVLVFSSMLYHVQTFPIFLGVNIENFNCRQEDEGLDAVPCGPIDDEKLAIMVREHLWNGT